MKNKRKKVITFPKNRAYTPIKKAPEELEQLELLQKRLNIVIPLITDSRCFIIDFFKIYTTVSIAINGGAILSIISVSVDKYFDSLLYFIGSLCILLATLVILSVSNIIPASQFKNRILSEKFDIQHIIKIINRDSKRCNCILFLSVFFSSCCFMEGSNIAINISRAVTL